MKKDLLFAILAAHNRIITEKQLLDIGVKWASNPVKSLTEMIQDEISDEQSQALAMFVKVALKRHNNSVDETLEHISKQFPAGKKMAMTLSDVKSFVEFTKESEDIQKTIESIVENVSHPEVHFENDLQNSVTFEQKGKYSIKDEHSRGGNGRILIAYDATIGRNIAMKELIPSEDAAEGTIDSLHTVAKRDRFIREARVTGQLQHPSIVPVYEIGCREDGIIYYTMKLVKGKTLKQAIKECESLEDALLLLPHFRDLCHAVSFAHANNVIHRDLKPENVMIGEFGETVLLDWGIAKVEGEKDDEAETLESCINQLKNLQTGQTIAGSAVGTPSYMSPEQARGEIEEVDKLSDSYSLGAVLYEILTGHPPFRGLTSLEIINKVVNEPFESFSKEKHPPPKELAAIVTKAMKKNKEKRYQSTALIAKDVERYMAGERVSVYEYSSWEMLKRFAEKNKPLVFAMFSILVIICISLVIVYQSYISEKKLKIIAEENEKEAHYHFAQSLYKKAEELFEKKQPMTAKIYASASLLNNPSNPSSPYFDKRFLEKYPQSSYILATAYSTHYLSSLYPQVKLEALHKGKEVYASTAFSSDRTIIAAACHDHTVQILDGATNQLRYKLSGHSGVVWDVEFMPGNDQIVASSSSDGTVKIWDIANKKEIRTLKKHSDQIWSISFSPDGKYLASASWDKKIVIWDTKSWNVIREFKKHSKRIWTVTWSESGKYVASGGNEKKLIIWNPLTGEVVNTIKNNIESVRDLAFIGDESIATATYDNNIYIFDTITSKIITTLPAKLKNVQRLSINQDKTILASANFDRTITLWDIKKMNEILTFQAHNGQVRDVSFSSDGSYLVSGGWDMFIKVWNINNTKKYKSFGESTSRLWKLDISPEDKYIASGDYDGEINIWKMDNTEIFKKLKGHHDFVFAVDFSPDGKYLASTAKTVMSLWSTETWKEEYRITEHSKSIWNVVFSPDSKYLASSSSDGTILITDVQSGKPVKRFSHKKDTIYNIAFSHDGKLLASGHKSKKVVIRNWKTGKIIRMLPHNDWVSGLSFTADDKRLFTCGKEGFAYYWDIETGKKLNVYEGHNGWVNFIKLSPDEKYIITSADDNTVRLWDVETAEPILIFPSEEALGIGFTKDGKYIAMGDYKQIKLYPMDLSFLQKSVQNTFKKDQRDAGLLLNGFIIKNIDSLSEPDSVDSIIEK